MPTLALRSELIKTRSLRVSFLVLPLAVVFLGGAAVVSLEIARRGDTGAGLRAMVESSAFAFSSGSLLSGLVLGVFGALIVTTDLGSGTINHSLILLPRRDIFVAKVALALLAAVATSVVGAVAVGLIAVALLPGSALTPLATSGVLWANLAGGLASHLTWASLGAAAAFVLRRQAMAMGGVLAIMLGLPAIGSAMSAVSGTELRWADYLPPGLMQAATVTGSEAVLAVGPLTASAGLLAWSGVLLAVGWLCFRRRS